MDAFHVRLGCGISVKFGGTAYYTMELISLFLCLNIYIFKYVLIDF